VRSYPNEDIQQLQLRLDKEEDSGVCRKEVNQQQN